LSSVIYGTLEGDETIISVAVGIKKAVHTNGFVARLGGDEFIIVLPKIEEKRAIEIANKVVESVRQLNIEHKYRLPPVTAASELSNQELRNEKKAIVTVSVGVTTGYVESNANVDWYNKFITALIQKTDDNLYKAKHNGRDGYFYEIYKG